MQFAQILVTDDQALKARLAIDLILQDPERYEMTDEERREFERLAVFFGYVASSPSSFAPTGAMAKTVKSIVRKARGPAQPHSRRKVRSQGQQKRDRKQRREDAAAYNEAREQFLAMVEEQQAQERELQEKFADEPRVMVLRADGQPILTDVPASMVVPMPKDEPAPTLDFERQPKITLPANVEKALEREADRQRAEGTPFSDTTVIEAELRGEQA